MTISKSNQAVEARLVNHAGEYPGKLDRQELRALLAAAQRDAERREDSDLPEDLELQSAIDTLEDHVTPAA